MTKLTPLPLVEQRQALRRRLQAQRRQIAHLLAPAPGVGSAYPRSMTMRLLSQRPLLAAELLAELAILLIGPRHFRSLSMALALVRVVHSIAVGSPPRRPVAPPPDS
jgi:hypothetical protein